MTMAKKLFSLNPAQDNLLTPKTTTGSALKNTSSANKITNVSSKTLDAINSNCTLQTSDTTINICSDKCVNVFVTENLTEQKYIKNVEGSGALCLGTLNTSNVYTNVVSNVNKIGFDTDSGFEVIDLGSGTAKVALNSTFKYWEVDGNPGLIACGLDTVNFIAGTGISITSDNTAVPKSLTINATGGGGGTPGGSNCQFQYNNSGTFAGACGLTYNSATGSVGLSKICVPSSNDLEITLSSSPTAQNAWYSLYGDGTSSFNDDYGSQVVYDNEGNIIIIGASDNPGSPFLVKYNNSGGVIWKKKFTEINNYYKTGDAVAVDSNNDIYCIIGTNDIVEDSTIFKISSLGSIIWQTKFTDTALTIAGTDLILDSSGNIYICFHLSTSIGVVKLNNSGVVQWQKQFNSANNIYPQGISLDASGNVLVLGRIDNGSGKYSLLLLKINSSGSLVWQNQYSATDPTSNQIYAGQITSDASDNLYVTGSFQTPGFFSDTGFVCKINSSGTLLWQKNISPPVLNTSTYYSGIVLDSNNDIYISGYGNPGGGNANDLLMTKLNNSGNIVWQRKFSGFENEYTYYFWSVKTIDVYNTSYAVTGYTYSPTGNGAEVVTLQFPTDGTLTGTYGYFQYAATTLTTDNNLFASAIGTTTEVPSTLSTTSGAYNIENDVNNSNLYIVSLASNVITANAQGQLSLSQAELPLSLNTGAIERIKIDSTGTYLNESLKLSITNQNLLIGSSNITLTGNNNVAIGEFANYCMSKCCNTTDNIAIGRYAGYCNIYGVYNVNIGTHAMREGYGSYSIAIGHCSMSDHKNGYQNTAIGNFSLSSSITGCDNTAVGHDGLRNLIDGHFNVALGVYASGQMLTGSCNIAIGGSALRSTLQSCNNIAIGNGSMCNQQNAGISNIAIGENTLNNFSLTPYCNNIAIGTSAGYYTEGNGNTLIGSVQYTSGIINDNLMLGTGSNCHRITVNNTGIYVNRYNSNNNTGIDNVAVGSGSLLCNYSGSYNIAIGCDALCQHITSRNIAIGALGLSKNTTGTNNIGIGICSGCNITTGSNNTIIGSLSGSAGLVCTVLIGAGTCERIKVDNNGLCINGAPFTATVNLDAYCSFKVGNGLGSSTGPSNFAFGCNALLCNTSGGDNIAIGRCALSCNTYAGNNVALGYGALRCSTTGGGNVAIGRQAMLSNGCGCFNVALGYGPLINNTGGVGNVAIGLSTLNTNTVGAQNIAIGSCALPNVTGINNVAIGENAMYSNTGGSQNVAIGRRAMSGNTLGGNNISLGQFSLAGNTSGNFNTAIGYYGLYGNRTGNDNIAIGCRSLQSNVSGSDNLAIGRDALKSANSTGCNIGLGFNAGSSITTGVNNTIIGSLSGTAGLVCTVLIGAGTCERIKVDNNGLCINGAPFTATVNLNAYCSFKVGNGLASSTGLDNFAFGCNALLSLTSGSSNFAAGWEASASNTYGISNISIGRRANRNNSVGSHNIALGDNALYGNTSGCHNIAMGRYVMMAGGSGSRNIALGYGSLSAVSTGCRNIVLGSAFAACDITTGINNTIIGNLPGGSGGLSCTVLIGAGQTERIKVNDTGLYINGSLFTGSGVTSVATSGSGLGFSLSGGPITTTGTVTLTVPTATSLSTCLQGDGLCNTSVGFRILPQNSQSVDYTLVAADSGKHLLHPSSDANARTFTIPANGTVAYPIGTSITFVNETTQVLTINITTDTMYLAGSGLTGSRTLGQYGVATAIKTGTTTWYISGTGLT